MKPEARSPKPEARSGRFLCTGLAVVCLGLAWGGNADAASRWTLGVAPAVYLDMFSLPQGGQVDFFTSNLTSGADPVLHLFRVLPDGSFQQVAVADDIAGPENRNAHLTYPTDGPADNFVLLLRAYDSGTTGTCNVAKDNVLRQAAAPVGGWIVNAPYFTYAAGDQLRTPHLPGGSVLNVLVAFTAPYTAQAMGIANDVAGAAQVPLTGNESMFLVGTPFVRDDFQSHTFREGLVMCACNDPIDDDNDGVGNLLEGAIGTCPTVAGCPYSLPGKDSDRDGLFDGEEVWGVAGQLPNGLDQLDFHRWGANPRKKDVFVEVDWLTNFGGPVPAGISPFQYMRENPTADIGGWTTGLEAWVAAVQQPYLSAPVAHIRNPDGSNGVAVHLDLGVAPLLDVDEAAFGAWSTGTPHGLVEDYILHFTQTVSGNVTLLINNTSYTFDATGLTPEQIGATVGFAALLLGQPIYVKSFVVQNENDATLTIAGLTPGLHFSRAISPVAVAVVEREDDNSLRNHYNVDAGQVDAVRRGRTRYAIVDTPDQGGQANGPALVTGFHPSTFLHELGHSLGLSHWGHSQWGLSGVDCIPHYFSVMNYANVPGFSASDAALQLNAARAVEQVPFGTAFNYNLYLASPYSYALPTGPFGVDWNRDGQLSPGQWRAPIFAMDSESCQGYAQGKLVIDTNTSVRGGVDLVRYDTRLFAVWATNDAVHMRSAVLGAVGAKSCTGSPDPAAPGECLTWSESTSFALGAGLRGVTAFSTPGGLLVATHDSFGAMAVHTFGVSPAGVPNLVGTVVLPSWNTNLQTAVTPELTVRHQGVHSRILGLVYLSRSGQFRSFGLDQNSWVEEGPLLDFEFGLPLAGAQAPVAKDWPDQYVQGWTPNQYRTVAVLPDATGGLRVFVLDYATNTWRQTGVAPGTTVAKPFLEYSTIRSTTGLPDSEFTGHFLIGRMISCAGGVCPFVHRSTLVSKAAPPAADSVPAFGLLGGADYIQNLWAISQAGTAAALYSDSSIDNVFGLFASAIPGDSGLMFYPHADGAPDSALTVHSDFRVMEDYICKYIGDYRSHNCGNIPDPIVTD